MSRREASASSKPAQSSRRQENGSSRTQRFQPTGERRATLESRLGSARRSRVHMVLRRHVGITDADGLGPEESKCGFGRGLSGDTEARSRAKSRREASRGRSGGERSSQSAEMRILRTVPDAFMVSLAHCHGKRGSSRAEHAHVKSARRCLGGWAKVVRTCGAGMKLVSRWLSSTLCHRNVRAGLRNGAENVNVKRRFPYIHKY